MSTRAKLLLVYFCSMLSLSMLNVVVSVVPTTLSDNALNAVFSVVSQMVCMGLIPIVGTALAKPRCGQSLGLYVRTWQSNWRYRMPKPKVWLVVLPLAVSFFYLTQLVARVNNLFLLVTGFQFSVSPDTIYGNAGDLVLWLVLGAVLPAVFEELTHRGLVLDAIFDRGNELEMIVFSGLLFACMHTNIMQFLYAFVGGCLFAFVTVKTGSILPAMFMHFFNNAFSYVQSYASQHPQGALGFVDAVDTFFTGSTAGILLGAVLLVGNAVLCLFLLSLVQRVAAPPKGLREIWLLRGKKTQAFAISVDTYRPFGRATLADNLPLVAVVAMTFCMTVFTYVWGMVR